LLARALTEPENEHPNRSEARPELLCDLPIWTETRLKDETVPLTHGVGDLRHRPTSTSKEDKGTRGLIVRLLSRANVATGVFDTASPPRVPIGSGKDEGCERRSWKYVPGLNSVSLDHHEIRPSPFARIPQIVLAK
jgi:hypothetical protein